MLSILISLFIFISCHYIDKNVHRSILTKEAIVTRFIVIIKLLKLISQKKTIAVINQGSNS